MKRGKKMPSDEDDSNDEDDDDNDNDDTKGKCKEVVEDREAPKGGEIREEGGEGCKVCPCPPFFNDSNGFRQEKGP